MSICAKRTPVSTVFKGTPYINKLGLATWVACTYAIIWGHSINLGAVSPPPQPLCLFDT